MGQMLETMNEVVCVCAHVNLTLDRPVKFQLIKSAQKIQLSFIMPNCEATINEWLKGHRKPDMDVFILAWS